LGGRSRAGSRWRAPLGGRAHSPVGRRCACETLLPWRSGWPRAPRSH
jgi:hypothetical protein